MNLAIFLVAAAIVCLFVILYISRSRALQVSVDASLVETIQPIDVEAFRNLANPADDEYLRRRLPPAEFRRVRRARLRAMSAYVILASKNAKVLVQIGQAAYNSTDTSTVEAARKLVNQALLLQLNAGIALSKIWISMLLPNSGLAAAAIVLGYEKLNGSAMLLSRLQNPAAPVRILAT
jgi:hypothetical protein